MRTHAHTKICMYVLLGYIHVYVDMNVYVCGCVYVYVHACGDQREIFGMEWFFLSLSFLCSPLSLILNSLYESKMYIPVGYSSLFSLYLYFLVRYFYIFTLWQVHVYTKWNLGHFSHHYPLLSIISSAKTQSSPTFMTFPDFLWVNYDCLHAHKLGLIIRICTRLC